MNESLSSLQSRLKNYRQEHLVAHWGNLDEGPRANLSREILSIDFAQLQRLQHSSHEDTDWKKLAESAKAPPAVRLNQQTPALRSRMRSIGEEAIACGRVGVILVAGGQGTRLGFDQPKGMFRIGPLSNRSLFEMHADRLIAVMNRYDVSIPLYIMTSPATDAETRSFFDSHDRFGLEPEQLIIFCQGTMPAVDEQSGKVLMSSPHEIALSPDGHGGMLQALTQQGCLQHAADRGIDQFFYAQVDNPLVPLADPELIGHHLEHRSQMTTQVVRKRFAKEKVGNVVEIDGRVAIIEYSDLPDSVAEKKDGDGEPLLWAGNIAVHVFDRTFLTTAQNNASLPFHRARKAVPHIDVEGNICRPKEPNAIKFERFIFDLLPLAERAIVVEARSEEVFAPVKNADGAPSDTPQSCKVALENLHRSWLLEAGAKIANSIRVEINPRWALDESQVAERIQAGTIVTADTYFSG